MHILVLSDNFMPLSNAERVPYLMSREYSFKLNEREIGFGRSFYNL